MSRTERFSRENARANRGEAAPASEAEESARPVTARPEEDQSSRLRSGPAGATMALSKPYKRCQVCGRVFPTRRQYLLETEPVRNNPEFPDGHMPAVGDDSHYYELRNCPCGATLVEKLRSERDRSPLGRLRRAMFSDLMDGHMVRFGVDREEARQRVLQRYEAFFCSHILSDDSPKGGEDQSLPAEESGAPASASARFEAMLSQRGLGAERDSSVEEAIWETFGRVRGLFILDTSGFSRRTKSQGIVHFLTLIQDLRERIVPILENHGAESHWYVADNVMAVFPDADAAFRAALATQRNVRIVNAGRGEDDRLEVCIGIGYGKVLVIGDEDVFGDEVNLASKLGEDIADPRQILLTESAYANAQHALEGLDVVKREIRIAGVEIVYYEVAVEGI